MTTPTIGIERNVAIPMPDGAVLMADIYRTLDDDASPALLERTPYSKSNGRYVGGLLLNPVEAVERGYAVVVQDVRGRFASEGDWEPFVNEGADGAATVDWIAAQPWCNGRVGVYGASYMGVGAIQTLARSPRALKAGVLYMTGSDYYRAWTYAGGAFELKFNLFWTMRLALSQALSRGEEPDEALALAALRPADLLHELPIKDIAAFTNAAPYWRLWHDHDTYDEYWRAVNAADRVREMSAPILHVTGWYDHFLRGHLDLYRAIEERGRLEQKLLVGPWDHGSYHASAATVSGDRDFGPAAVNGPALMSGLALGWFDRWLKGVANEPSPKVRYFVMGENRWHDAATWPPPHIPTSFFLRSGNVLSEFAPAGEEPYDSYIYDPNDPVPTIGGRGSSGSAVLGSAGVRDQAVFSQRTDVACYTTAHLMDPVTIAGPIELRLFAAASTPATDFTAKLVDVQPDGYCAILADGITRVFDSEPGHVAEHVIDLWAVAHRFQPGHRIRVEVSGGSFPRYDRNPNTGKKAATAIADDFVPTTHQLLHDSDRPSRLILPVLESRGREARTER